MPTMDNHVALVTGGARGNGEAQCRALVTAGARVMISDVLDYEGEKLAEELGAHASYLHLDVSDQQDWAAAVIETERQFGPISVLVNNAGISGLPAPLEDYSIQDWERVVSIDLTGTFLGMRHVAPGMKAAKRGSIVNISSVLGHRGAAFAYPYVAAKWGVRGLTKSAAIELASHNIRVNAVAPGFFDTPMMAATDPADIDIPMRRSGQSAELAKTVVFLASEDSSFTTGAEIIVDGGLLSTISSFDSLHGIVMSGPRSDD
ncbi:3-alpha-hydroxysteroid dehydrogenase [Rhodococcus sp. ACPA4]|uniref:SDR family NAD(P)-dependent oxidoreductase n=1 Tax=Rhodococcus TaxID=1827 RepID=UPI000BB158C6|nr:SDR family NAD(P)-dependent oxidoreductase [Rhodococcus sp. ACPA4]PBC36075.1 3-alpha-hydroxysteroid dehydrogenase [Rhodococcus sp. ACPA4]